MPISSAILDVPIAIEPQPYVRQETSANYAINFSPSIPNWVHAPVVVFFLSAGIGLFSDETCDEIFYDAFQTAGIVTWAAISDYSRMSEKLFSFFSVN